MYGQFPMTSYIPDGRRAAVRAYPMTILRYVASSRADGRAQSDGRIKIGIAAGSGPEVDRLVAIWGVRVSPRADAQNGVDYIRTSTRGTLSKLKLFFFFLTVKM